MQSTLSNFYRSKEWISLKNMIMLERRNEEGLIICEHCGKPIIKKYDCIGHHKIYLNQQNYLDANIALNPDNIALVHHACHNRIHHKGFTSQSERQVFLVYGSPLSGKTTYVDSVMETGDIILDIDRIWQAISGQKLYVKPNQLKSNVFELRDTIIKQIKYRQGRWMNAYIIGGYPLASERESLCKQLGAREVFVECSMDECLRRLEDSKDRDYQSWKKYIEDWFRRFEGRF